MSFDYAAARLTAQRLIDKFGQSAVFYIPEQASGGYDDRGNPIPAQPRQEFAGIVTPIDSLDKSLIDGENFRTGDGSVFFHTENKPPIQSLIDINGITYTLVSVMDELTSIDGTNVYLELQIRQGG